MSYSMSPPAQKPAPSPYPPQPYPNSASPTAQSPYAPPPAKRQRRSPDPRSPPNGTSNYPSPAHSMQGGYGNPYGQQSAVQSPYSPGGYSTSSPQQSQFNTPQAYAPPPMPWPQQQQQQQQQAPSQFQSSPPPAPSLSSQMMPPPPRPNKEEKDERIGVEDIGDSLFGSGINLKDEENYLHNTWNNRHAGHESFHTTQSTSFSSSTLSPNNSFNLLTQGTSFGSQGQDGAFVGTMSQPLSQDEIDAEVRRKREAAARQQAERHQHHLNNQFLLGNCLRNRMHLRAFENGVKLDVHGVYLRKPDPPTKVMVNGTGTEGVVSAGAESLIEAGALYEHILSLVSLATGERLRGLIDEAYGLSRARRYGDHGRVVPPEFADIATGEGKQQSEEVVPENITGSPWDKVPQTDTPASVNGDAQANNHDADTPQPMPTVSFQGTLNSHLRDLANHDRQAEKLRLQRRTSRKRKAENSGANDDPMSTDMSGEAPSSGTAANADTAAAPGKISKKEASKKAKESSSQHAEAQLFNQSNQTAAMMALGKKGNRYSWMSGGASNMPTNRFAKPAAAANTTPATAAAPAAGAVPANKPETPVSGITTPAATATGTASTAIKDGKSEERIPTWGDWREDRGVQMRDWVVVLERDGKDKKALEKARGLVE